MPRDPAKTSLTAAFLNAVYDGDWSRAQSFAAEGADIHADDDAALCIAARNGETRAVAALLNNGADADARDHEPLIDACKNGYAEIVKLLLDHGAKTEGGNDDPLTWAASNGHADIVKLLIDAGADPATDKHHSLKLAAERGRTEIVRMLLGAGADVHVGNDHCLKWAAANGHAETVRALLEEGADIHADDDYALEWAKNEGYDRTVAVLEDWIAHSEKIRRGLFLEKFRENPTVEFLREKNKDGLTRLQQAARFGALPEVVRKVGDKLSADDFLHEARGHVTALDILARQGDIAAALSTDLWDGRYAEAQRLFDELAKPRYRKYDMGMVLEKCRTDLLRHKLRRPAPPGLKPGGH